MIVFRRFVSLLCSPKSILLVNLENPKDVVQTISRNGRLKFCGVQWHPHSYYSGLFLCGVSLWGKCCRLTRLFLFQLKMRF